MNGMLPSISIREVGPRDGLQSEAPISVADRVALISALIAAGVSSIEMCSFVSPKAVPSMAGGAEVLAAVGFTTGVRRVALVPNLRGAQMALAAGIDELTATVSASAKYSEKNVHMSVDASVSAAAEVCVLAASCGVPTDVVVSCAFGSPYEGEMDPAEIVTLGAKLLDGGAARLTFADTTGVATPARVTALLDGMPDRMRADVGLHLHDTRGTALVNAYAAMLAGVTRFDTAVGGLGGSPFAAGAGGNLATEDLVHLCDDLEISTGISLDLLLRASTLVAGLVGHIVPSRVAAHGPRTRLAGG